MIAMHPRLIENTEPARRDVMDAVTRAVVKHKLTPLEVTRILLDAAHQWSAYALRDERHGDNPHGKKADEA